jgi:hypothetical protein
MIKGNQYGLQKGKSTIIKKNNAVYRKLFQLLIVFSIICDDKLRNNYI